MSVFRDHLSGAYASTVNFLPGLVILVFGMLALYSTVSMSNIQDLFFGFYKEKTYEVYKIQKSYHEFEEALNRYYFGNKSEKDKRTVEAALAEFIAEFSVLKPSGQYERAEFFVKYRRLILLIQAKIINISGHIDEIGRYSNIDEYTGTHPDFEALHGGVEDLWYLLYNKKQVEAIYSDTATRAAWLYWSVITLGLVGFLLAILNAQKLNSLKRLNSERRETLDLLNQRLAAIESTFDGIGIVDARGNLVYMNKALKNLHDLTDAQANSYYIGRPWVNLYSRKGQEDIERNVMPVLMREGYWRGESPIVKSNGGIAHADLSLTVLPDGGFIGTARDITTKKQAEEEKEALLSQFFQAQKMEALGRLAGGVAHDFNNLLAAINGYAEFLTEDLEDRPPQRRFADNILKAVMQARRLVDQILAFSRVQDARHVPLDLGLPVGESISLLEASLPRTIEVVKDIRIESAPIEGNETQMAQVVMNLCVNARDALEHGRGRITITLDDASESILSGHPFIADGLPDPADIPPTRVEETAKGETLLYMGRLASGVDYICLAVEDTGSGMSFAVMEHSFDPFFTTKDVSKGTGLGLSTVHGIVRSHRGALQVHSRTGQGTRFNILLPKTRNARIPLRQEKDDAKENTMSGARILLVDDQAAVREVMRNMIARLGYDVVEVASGAEALEILKTDKPGFDLAVSDHNMPAMTGLELVMKVNIDFPDLPFILVSGYDEQQIHDLMREQPAICEVLRKPVMRDVLAQAIRKALMRPRNKTA